MTIKIIFFTLILFIFSLPEYSQVVENKKSTYLEIGGSAGVGSINYEAIFTRKKNVDLFWRIGVSGFPIDKNNGFTIITPIVLGGLVGKKNNFLELGIGQGISLTTKGNIFALAIPIIGYRHQNREKKIFYRLSYTPLISYLLNSQYQNWAGISIGLNL